LFNVFHYLKKKSKVEKRKVLHHLAYGLIVFSGINAIWIGMISYKYNEITLGTAARGTHAYFGPDVPDFSGNHPRGFIKPPNETAVSIWEDDYHTIINHYWNPFASWRNFKHQLKLILKSLQESYRVTLRFSPLSATIIIFYILYFFQKKSTIFKKEFLNPLVTLALYSSGYILIGTVVDRYLWIDYVLLLLMGGYVINLLFRSSFFNETRKTILLIFFSISFIVYPMFDLKDHINDGKDIYNLSQILANQHKISGKIASNAQWAKSLYISYHLKCQYYGEKIKNINDENLQTELQENNIDYYFFWRESNGDSQITPDFLLNHRKIFDDRIPDLIIFDLREIR